MGNMHLTYVERSELAQEFNLYSTSTLTVEITVATPSLLAKCCPTLPVFHCGKHLKYPTEY